jgi:hypothetical protein
MHTLIYAVAALMFAVPAPAQSLTTGCGNEQMALEVLEVFSPRFTSADSEYASYRQKNALNSVDGSEPQAAVRDAAVCEQLEAIVEAELRATSWGYWGAARWESAYARIGPYYLVYIEERMPDGVIGSAWLTFLIDAVTFALVPTPYECNC